MSRKPLPRAVQAQLDAANALVQTASQQTGPVATPLELAAQQVSSTPPATTAPPAGSETPPVSTPTEPTPQPLADDAWQQRYRTLEGMVRSQLSEAAQATNAAKAAQERSEQRIGDLVREIEQLKVARPTVDPKDVETFGADLVDMVRRQASVEIKQAVEAAFGQLTKRVETLEGGTREVSTQVAKSTEQLFYSALSSAVPDWQAVNQDQRFLQWLATEDPVYGAPRQAALQAAHQNLQAARVAAIFNAFKATLAPKPTESTQPTLQSQVTPSSTGSNSSPAAQDAPTYVSERDIRKFYDDVRKGVFRGRPDEERRLEAAINSAIAQGRVIP